MTFNITLFNYFFKKSTKLGPVFIVLNLIAKITLFAHNQQSAIFGGDQSLLYLLSAGVTQKLGFGII